MRPLGAGIAQLVVHLICNQGVGGSSPSAGTSLLSPQLNNLHASALGPGVPGYQTKIFSITLERRHSSNGSMESTLDRGGVDRL